MSDRKGTAAINFQPIDRKQRVVLITGANCGIGFQTSLQLACKGWRVILACRNPIKAKQAMREIIATISSEIKDSHHPRLDYLTLDLTSLESVKSCAEDFLALQLPLDALICNAGINSTGSTITGDKLEAVFQVNFLSHFYLIQLLLERLIESKPSRIIHVSSVMHRWGNADFSGHHDRFQARSYSNSKLAQIMLSYELQRRYYTEGVTNIVVSPGAVNSNIWRNNNRLIKFITGLMFLSPAHGAATSVAAACTPLRAFLANDKTFFEDSVPLIYLTPYQLSSCCPRISGSYNIFKGPTVSASSNLSYDRRIAAGLYDWSATLLKKMI